MFLYALRAFIALLGGIGCVFVRITTDEDIWAMMAGCLFLLAGMNFQLWDES